MRYCAPTSEVAAFDRELGTDLPAFILYGSGDFHYLAAIWARRAGRRLGQGGNGGQGGQAAQGKDWANRSQLTVVSFDNHPDWDIRPPRWACGGWICRALEFPHVRAARVWGCGNFELALPARLFANRAALRSGRLTIHAWAERQKASVCRRFDCMNRSDWRERFERFLPELAAADVYITVDLDCLRSEDALTNWENGLFTTDDLAWAIGRLRDSSRIVGGDLCGAWSRPVYARRGQRFAGNWDHPRLPDRDESRARAVNSAALAKIWPVLTGTLGPSQSTSVLSRQDRTAL